jgi:hypothetical protein
MPTQGRKNYLLDVLIELATAISTSIVFNYVGVNHGNTNSVETLGLLTLPEFGVFISVKMRL